MKDRTVGLLFLAPTILIILLIFVYPLLMSLWSSLHYDVLSQPERYRFVGLQNYLNVLQQKEFWNALKNTTVFFVGAVVGTLALGLTMGLLLDRDLGRFEWVRPLYLVPMVIAPVVVGVQWRFMLNQTFGIIPYLLQSVGIPTSAWLTQPWPAMICLILVDIWYETPMVTLLVSAGLVSIQVDVREAAKVDGASAWQTIRFVLVPILKPVLVVALLIRTIGALRVFDTIWVITEGGPARATEVANILAYKVAFRYFNMGTSSSIAWLLLIVAVALSGFYLRALREHTATV